MSRPNPLILFTVLFGVFVAYSWLSLRAGALLISEHEGDTFHLLDILLRMQEGQVPHIDFVTPIGILAFLPIHVFLDLGYGAGTSILYAQILVAGALLPLVFYTAWSRLSPKAGYLFGAFTMVLILALSFGGRAEDLSISMHYNRWAWAIGSLLILLAFAPKRIHTSQILDGIVVGLCFAILALLKVTFFVGLLPGVAGILLLRRQIPTLVAAAIVGVGFALVATVMGGVQFWFGYFGDLLTVSSTDVRPHPSASLSELIGSPKTAAFSILGFTFYWMVSRAGLRAESFGLLLLIPGCFFITYQNFGNDPKWVVPLAALLVAYSSAFQENEAFTSEYRRLMISLPAAAILLFLPSILTVSLSTVRHAFQPVDEYSALLPTQTAHQDIATSTKRGTTLTARVELDVLGSPWLPYREAADRPDPKVLNGVTFPECQLLAGMLSWFDALTNELGELGTPEGSQLFVADLLVAFWLFGPYEPLQGGAPWYYGNLSGLENADYLVVPKCGFVPEARNIIIDELNASDIPLSTVADTELLALFAVGQP